MVCYSVPRFTHKENLSILKVVKAAYALMSDTNRISIGHNAKNADDLPVAFDDPTAYYFCSLGAIEFYVAQQTQDAQLSLTLAVGAKAILLSAIDEQASKGKLPVGTGISTEITAFHDVCALKHREVFLETWRQAVVLAQKEVSST